MLRPAPAVTAAARDPAVPLCPACGGVGGPAALRRARVSVHQNLLCATRDEARAVPRGELALGACPTCGLVWNHAFDPARMTYTGTYDSDQSGSPAFLRHVDARIDALLDDGLRGATIVEAGCGSGHFLRRLCARAACRGYGYDPGYRGPERDPGGVSFARRVFEGAASLPPGERVDAVICRHVIEHVPAPAAFVQALARGLPRGTRFYFETPAFEWIAARTALWDVFYEHCNYFTAAAFARVLELGGLTPSAVTPVFEGQYLWAAATLEAPAPARAPLDPLAGPRLAAFARACDDALARLHAQVERLLSVAGRVAVWGAAAKGATYAALVDPDATRLDCLVDVNPARHGRYLAGTGHVIVAPGELTARDVGAVLVMNPNYLDEIRAQAARAGARVHLELVGAA